MARRVYGEADRIVSVFSENYGRLSLLAKGVRKPSSRKRGHLEVFSYISFSAVTGRGIDLITEAQLIENFPRVRVNLKKASVAYFLVEAVGRLTRENESHGELFEILLSTLHKLNDTDRLKSLRSGFTKEILVNLGFWPQEKPMADPDNILQEVTERELSSIRVGKMLQ